MNRPNDDCVIGHQGDGRKLGMKRGNTMTPRWSREEIEQALADGYATRRIRKAAKRLGLAVSQ